MKYDATINWIVTDSCNFNCQYCFGTQQKKPAEKIDISKLSKSIEKTDKTRKFHLSGGEPFLVPNIIEASKEISKNHYLSFTTNLSSKNLKKFFDEVDPKKVLYIIASIHFFELKKRKLSKLFLKNYHYGIKKGFNLECSIVGYPEYFKNLDIYRSFLEENNINYHITPFLGNYNDKKYPEAYTKEEKEKLDYNQEKLSMYNSFDKICPAGYNALACDKKGNLFRCHNFMQNGKQNIISNIYDKIKFKNKYLKCPFKECGCPFYAYEKNLLKEKEKIGFDTEKMNFKKKSNFTKLKKNIRKKNLDKPINIACTFDESYKNGFYVMLNSLYLNLKSNQMINVYIMESDLSEESKKEIEMNLPNDNISIKFIKINDEKFKHYKTDSYFKTKSHIKTQAYFRILLPKILPNIRKILYLDTDLIINSDITPLWNVDLEKQFIAAVEDDTVKVISSKVGVKNYKKLNLDPAIRYFNSGVMLMDLEKWRSENISKKVFDYINRFNDDIIFWDQDALNGIIAGRWKKLGKEWNYQVIIGNPDEDYKPIKNTKIENPKIIHFTTQYKPWNSPFKLPYKQVFQKYLDKIKVKNSLIQTNPKVSVIIPTYNRAEILEINIKSLLQQSYKNIEIIIADDGSTDQTKEVISKLQSSNKNIKYVFQQDDGFRAGQARNLGAKYASGNIIVFVNDDLIAMPNMIAEYVKNFPKNDVVVGYAAGYDNKNDKYSLQEIKKHLSKKTIDSVRIIPEERYPYFENKTKNPVWIAAYTTNIAIKKKLFMENMFDENFQGFGTEDAEIAYRLFLKNKKIILDKKCIGLHIHHNTSDEIEHYNQKRAEEHKKNLLYFYNKYPDDDDVKAFVLSCYNDIPPVFKKKNDLDNILPEYTKILKNKKTKTARIRISNKCNSNCIFCSKLNKKSIIEKSTNTIKLELKLLKKENFKKIIFPCNTDMRSDFIDLIKFAKFLDFDVILETNAKMFSYENLIKNSIKFVDKFVVTYIDSDNNRFDKTTRTKDQMKYVLKGEENIKKFPSRISYIYDYR